MTRLWDTDSGGKVSPSDSSKVHQSVQQMRVAEFVRQGFSEADAVDLVNRGMRQTDGGVIETDAVGGYGSDVDQVAANTAHKPLTRGPDGRLRTSVGAVVETTRDGVRITDTDGRTGEMKARPAGGPDAMPVPPAPRENPLAPFVGNKFAEVLSNFATLGKVADLQCVAEGQLNTPAFGDLEFKADLVQGGGVQIKGDNAVFKNEDTWALSRKPTDDGNYQLFATSLTTQKSYGLLTLGNVASAALATVFSGDGLLTYANPVEIREAFPGTKTATLRDVLDGVENKHAAKVVEKMSTYGLPFVDVMDGRFQIGSSLNFAGQKVALGCSADAAQGVPRLGSMLIGIPGMALEDWAKSIGRKK